MSRKLLVSLLLTMHVFIVPAISFAEPKADHIRLKEVDAFTGGGLIVADDATLLFNASSQGCSDQNWCPPGAKYCKGAHIPMDTEAGRHLYATALSGFLAGMNIIVVTDGCWGGLPKVVRIGVVK